MKAQRVDVIHVDGQKFELAPGYSQWHIEKGVTGKHHGLSYCEACDYVPPHIVEFDSRYLEDTRGPQLLSRYCPSCGRRMRNSDYEED